MHPIPSSPPKITPIVVTALQTLLTSENVGYSLGQLLLLEQDIDFIGLSFKREYFMLEDYVTIPPSMSQNVESAGVKEVKRQFLGDNPPRPGRKPREREFLDAEWCQRYLDALFGIESDYPLAVSVFIDSMLMYGTAGFFRIHSDDMPQWDQTHTLRTLNEFAVMKVAGAFTEKPQWETKVDNEGIVEKWRSEAVEQDLDPVVVDVAIKRVQWLRKTRDTLTGSALSHITGVYISDSLMDDDDLSALKDMVATLEDVPDKFKDWHPGSDGQVLDLLHPSLYPYVRGRTPRYVPETASELPNDASHIERLSVGILKGCGTLPVRHSYTSPEAALASFGEGLPTTPQSARKDTIELTWPREQALGGSDVFGNGIAYQWLPTDVYLSNPTTERVTFPTVQFLSYINNLHPRSSTKEERMYSILERLFAKFVPMFGRVICNWEARPHPAFPEPVYPDSTSEEDNDDDNGTAEDETEAEKEGHASEGDGRSEEQDDIGERDRGKGVEGGDGEVEEKAYISVGNDADGSSNSPPFDTVLGVLSEADEGSQSAAEMTEDEPNMQNGFEDSDQLQVIVKLANIHLTPEKPDYPGGSWHVEGTHAEHICATGIYYYDSENITTSKLSFRAAVDMPDFDDYQQNRFGRLARKFGIYEDEPANQLLGSLVTQQGRCICFPNNMQHRVEPFSLADRMKPGHLKILAFFLINPRKRVLSTSDVPPQQFEWFASEIRKGDSRLSILPQEVFDVIMEQVSAMATEEGYPWPMSREEAMKHRELFMAERGKFAVHANGLVYEREFYFCEH